MCLYAHATAFLRSDEPQYLCHKWVLFGFAKRKDYLIRADVKQARERQKLRVGFAPITADTDIDLERHREPETKAGLFHFGLGEMLGFI